MSMPCWSKFGDRETDRDAIFGGELDLAPGGHKVCLYPHTYLPNGKARSQKTHLKLCFPHEWSDRPSSLFLSRTIHHAVFSPPIGEPSFVTTLNALCPIPALPRTNSAPILDLLQPCPVPSARNSCPSIGCSRTRIEPLHYGRVHSSPVSIHPIRFNGHPTPSSVSRPRPRSLPLPLPSLSPSPTSSRAQGIVPADAPIGVGRTT